MMLYFPTYATSYSWPRKWNTSETSCRQVSWLIDPYIDVAFPISQWYNDILLPIYSDEFAQDFHLFSPFHHAALRHDTCSPLPAKLRT